MNIKKVFNPGTIEETLELLDKYKDSVKLIAGGTDMLIELKKDGMSPEVLIDIFKIEELKNIEEKDDEIVLGACVTYTDIVENNLFNRNLFGLKKSCRLVGSPQIRNKGTIGGNIAHGAPSADAVPPLLCLDAKITIESLEGKREITLEEYYESPLKTNELLTYISFKKPDSNAVLSFSKLGLRKALAISRLTNSALIDFEGDTIKTVRISSGALGKTPLRERKVEEYLLGKKLDENTIEEAIVVLRESVEERLKGRSTLVYKSSAIDTILKEALEEAKSLREELRQ